MPSTTRLTDFAAAAVIALHALDDAFVADDTGTTAADQLLSASSAAAATVSVAR